MNTNKLTSVLLLIISPAGVSRTGADVEGGNLYLIGAMIALLILAYLVYSLLKPEKF